jgi:ubiquinone/menaquinone biosynthesis C-methylase UbiE
MFARFLASQLRRPTGWFGRIVMSRALNYGNADLIGSTLDALHLQPQDDFLDVGFGGGAALIRAASVVTRGRLVGIDFSPDVVAQGKRRLASLMDTGRLDLMEADVSAIPLPDGNFTKIATTNTVYFWPEPQAAAAELWRLLAPGGALAVGFTGAEKMASYRTIATSEHGFRRWCPDEVSALLTAVGFCDVVSVSLTGKRTRGDFVVQARRHPSHRRRS